MSVLLLVMEWVTWLVMLWAIPLELPSGQMLDGQLDKR